MDEIIVQKVVQDITERHHVVSHHQVLHRQMDIQQSDGAQRQVDMKMIGRNERVKHLVEMIHIMHRVRNERQRHINQMEMN